MMMILLVAILVLTKSTWRAQMSTQMSALFRSVKLEPVPNSALYWKLAAYTAAMFE